MTAIRINVKWMTHVPAGAEDEDDYDNATWDGVVLHGIKAARAKAQQVANSNPWGQAWIYFESAPNEHSPEWQWETDSDSTEIITSEVTA